MTDPVDGITISNKVKEFLTKKLSDSQVKIKEIKEEVNRLQSIIYSNSQFFYSNIRCVSEHCRANYATHCHTNIVNYKWNFYWTKCKIWFSRQKRNIKQRNQKVK